MLTVYNPKGQPSFRFLVVDKKVRQLTLKNGLWVDSFGTVWALREESATTDHIDRCGVGVFSIPATNHLTGFCKIHDYKYTSPAYQVFYTREEADKALRDMLIDKGYPITGTIFYWLSRIFGRYFWENKETNI